MHFYTLVHIHMTCPHSLSVQGDLDGSAGPWSPQQHARQRVHLLGCLQEAASRCVAGRSELLDALLRMVCTRPRTCLSKCMQPVHMFVHTAASMSTHAAHIQLAMRLLGDGLLTQRESAAWSVHAVHVREELQRTGCTSEGVASLLFAHKADMRLEEFRQRMNAVVRTADSHSTPSMAKDSPPPSPTANDDSTLSGHVTPPKSRPQGTAR